MADIADTIIDIEMRERNVANTGWIIEHPITVAKNVIAADGVTTFESHLTDYVKHPGYATATGNANTYVVILSPAPTSYVDGMGIVVKINVASTGASTINVNNLGAINILDSLGNAITSGGLKANTPYTLRYNGTSFIVQGKGGGGNAIASDLLLGKTATTDQGTIIGTEDLNNLIPSNILSGVTVNGILGSSLAAQDTSSITSALITTLDNALYSGSSADYAGAKIVAIDQNDGIYWSACGGARANKAIKTDFKLTILRVYDGGTVSMSQKNATTVNVAATKDSWTKRTSDTVVTTLNNSNTITSTTAISNINATFALNGFLYVVDMNSTASINRENFAGTTLENIASKYMSSADMGYIKNNRYLQARNSSYNTIFCIYDSINLVKSLDLASNTAFAAIELMKILNIL